MCKQVDEPGAEDVINKDARIPEPGQLPPPMENPLAPPRHLTKYSTVSHNFDNKEELPDLELSPCSDAIRSEDEDE